ncbi:MarR family transcriptional regulator [Pseudoxanthobacter sp.]|uniref:MarR family winged helix-turn-helix transcriptional regulator n=1 Tax=Pseudoxanthobacter sp. TaxID=1925742 RepID=UPI002FDFD473
MGPLSESETRELLRLISGVNRQVEQATEARLKPFGVSLEHYRVLEALEARDGRAMGELAAQIFVDAPTLTKIIDRMVAGGDVFRAPDPQDRRKVLIFRSARGAAHFAELRGLLDGAQNGLVGRLARSEADQLRSLLQNMLSGG